MSAPVDSLQGPDGRPTYVRVSIGIATFPHDIGSADEITRLADKRMYAQKRRIAACVDSRVVK
jgi:GGDEF domain-containing protein